MAGPRPGRLPCADDTNLACDFLVRMQEIAESRNRQHSNKALPFILLIGLMRSSAVGKAVRK